MLTINNLVVPANVLDDMEDIWNLSVDLEDSPGRRLLGPSDLAGDVLEADNGAGVVSPSHTEWVRGLHDGHLRFESWV